MADDFNGNVLPTPLSPFTTGNPKADAAIAKLQAWPMSPATPFPRPTGHDYDETLALAESAGPEPLVQLLDDAAIQTGVSRWDDDFLKSLRGNKRKAFHAHYEAVVGALAVRKAYLHWLIGAVCNTPDGLTRALEICAGQGTSTARVVAASTVWEHLRDPGDRRRFGEALDLREWDGEDHELERVYRLGVAALSEVDPAAAYDRYVELLGDDEYGTPVHNRTEALLFGLIACAHRDKDRQDAIDPRWVAGMLPLLSTGMDNLVLMVLERMPPDPSTLAPLCAYLPNPSENDGYWNQTAVRLLARVADASALPWLVAALRDSWMNWPAVFEGFRKVDDPAMAHVIREWLVDNDAPDRSKVARPLIKQLERNGAAPKPKGSSFEPEPEPAPERPTLVYEKADKFEAPKLDSLASITKLTRKAFAAAELDPYFDKLAQRAVYLIPKRVNEAKLELGRTKLGGHPELPAKAAWPRVKGVPLTFLAQIALAEVAPLLPKGVLPPSGLLSFFVGADPHAEIGYLEHAKLLFTPARAKLVRHEVPDDFAHVIYQAATVKLHPTLSLPSPSNAHVTKLLKGDKLARYEDQVFDVTAPALPQLLGFRSHGYDAEEKATSQLLLQLTGEDQTEMEFGDCDFLSVFIHEQKLAARDFAKVWPKIGD